MKPQKASLIQMRFELSDAEIYLLFIFNDILTSFMVQRRLMQLQHCIVMYKEHEASNATWSSTVPGPMFSHLDLVLSLD